MPFARDRSLDRDRSVSTSAAPIWGRENPISDYIRRFYYKNGGEGQKVDGDQRDRDIQPHGESPRQNVARRKPQALFDNADYHSSGDFADSVFDADCTIHNFQCPHAKTRVCSEREQNDSLNCTEWRYAANARSAHLRRVSISHPV